MNGYTVNKKVVTKTTLIEVNCNKCDGICDPYTEMDPTDKLKIIEYYKCISCGVKHLNSTGEKYPSIEYVTH